MKRMISRALLFLYLALQLPLPGLAQLRQERIHRRVPCFHSRNPVRLSAILTRNLKDDSMKAAVIHSWIVYNIKYDVKKWRHFDYTTQPVTTILRKRKATCLGYSKVYDELCKNAGITSVTVPGYSKDFNVDPVDNFYLDEHCWNAALIGGKWRLTDACWDAGYIAFYKTTVWGYFLRFFTLGKRTAKRFSPHFVRFPIQAYHMRSGNFFKTDHLPLDPLWQLQSIPMQLEEFKKDSSFYFKKYPWEEARSGYSDSHDYERQDYASRGEEDKLKINGIKGHAFNPANHYGIGITWSLRYQELLKKFDWKSKDTVRQLSACDTLLHFTHLAGEHFDSNAYYLLKQKTELSLHSEWKKRITGEQNKKLIASTNKCISALRRGGSVSKQGRYYIKRQVKKNRKEINEIEKYKAFHDRKPAKKPNPGDSLAFIAALQTLNDSISKQEDFLKQLFLRLDTLYMACVDSSRLFADGSGEMTFRTWFLIVLREEMNDDYDFQIRKPKDELLKLKFLNDSLLFDKDESVFSGLMEQLRQGTSTNRQLIRLQKTRIRLITGLKSSCISTPTPKMFLREMHSSVNQEAYWMELQYGKWKGYFKERRKFCKNQFKLTCKERKAYKKELVAEHFNDLARRSYINRHYAALLRGNVSACRRVRNDSNKIMRYKDNLKINYQN